MHPSLSDLELKVDEVLSCNDGDTDGDGDRHRATPIRMSLFGIQENVLAHLSRVPGTAGPPNINQSFGQTSLWSWLCEKIWHCSR